MEGKGYMSKNGPAMETNGIAVQPRRASVRLRTPTVHEALPYTPMSSIVPFHAELIPHPTASPNVAPCAFSDLDNVKSTRKILERLSAGADGAEAASSRCQQTLRDMQRLLDPDALTQFKMKAPRHRYPSRKSAEAQPISQPKLSNVAQMVLDGTAVAYVYVTPTAKLHAGAHVGNVSKGPLTTTKAYSTTPASRSDLNGHPTLVNHQAFMHQRSLQAVRAEQLTPAQKAEYQLVAGDESNSGYQNATLPKPRTSQLVNGIRPHGDGPSKAEIAVETLSGFLQELLEAEDGMESDTSGNVPTSNAHLAYRETKDGSVPLLRTATQEKLETYVSRVVAHGRLDEIDAQRLGRVQRLCERSASVVESLALRIYGEWSDADIEGWSLRLEEAENSISAVRTLIRIMTGGVQQKVLQSEDFFRSVLEALRTIVEDCIVPIAEDSASSGEKLRGEKSNTSVHPSFTIAVSHRKLLQSLLNGTTKCLRLLGEFLTRADVEETKLSSVEFLCKTLIFAENASTEKDSAIGIQNFEAIRRCAVDVLAKIFAKYTEQRQYIFDEILISLEKLPATKQSARQYKLKDAKPIQLVSALLMRLLQTSATTNDDTSKLSHRAVEYGSDEEDASGESEGDGSDYQEVKVSPSNQRGLKDSLTALVKPLHDSAQQNASYIVKILVQRALSTSKSSDEPYRKLLDIFTEDFLNVVGSPEWPAAELILQTLVVNMINIAENSKSPVPSRTLALELLGTMGSGILELQFAAQAAAQGFGDDDDVSQRLVNLASQATNVIVEPADLVQADGPYRIISQYLERAGAGEDPHLQSARGYVLVQWSLSLMSARDGSAEPASNGAATTANELRNELKRMILDPKSQCDLSDLPQVSTKQSRLAAKIVTLGSRFCRAFARIFNLLLNSMSNDHSTVKSRSLKSVVTLLEKDPTILERHSFVINQIVRCASDSSPLVRDSALSLIAKCISLRPDLDTMLYPRVIARANDAAIGVRKRAMKLLKEIYLRNQSKTIRSAIADAIIKRIADAESSIVEIARTMIEEIWFQPFHDLRLEGENSVSARLAYGNQAALLIETLENSEDAASVLETLSRRLLSGSKAFQANFQVCQILVTVFFEGIVDSDDIPGSPAQDAVLRALTVFARAGPELFTAAQLERLEPYTQNLANSDDLEVYRSVITIFRHVMPRLTTMKKEFLENMQTTLLTSVPRLQKAELRSVAPCLWTINGILHNIERLLKFMVSVVSNIYAQRKADLMNDQVILKVTRLMVIAGEFGNACDFDGHVDFFKARCPWYQGGSVPGLIVEALYSYTSPKLPHHLRRAALDAVCTVAQAWPKQFIREDVTKAFQLVFQDRDASLEEVLLDGLEGFFRAQEVPEVNEDGSEPDTSAQDDERLGRTYVASDQDGASTSLAQRFLSELLRIALASCTEAAFTAARVVISINKQGLVHPKQSGPALVALETCPNKVVAGEAFKEHKAQHQKHESLFEKEYMRAVQQAFEYQQKVIGDAGGLTAQPLTAKLHLAWEVLKTGKAQARKKFISNLAQKLDFNPSRLDLSTPIPQHLAYVRFCVENLALFDYDKVDDILHTLTSLEKVFSGTGSTLAQAIEAEVQKIHVDALASSKDSTADSLGMVMPSSTPVDTNPVRLHQLAVSAQILSMIWETRLFLRRLWNMQKHMARSKKPIKDTNRTPTRATNAPALTETYVKRVQELASSVNSFETQRAMCSSFVELISVDNEVKVGSEQGDDAELADGYETPSEGTSRKSPSMPANNGAKKRKSVSIGGTPRKKGRPSLGKSKSGSFSIGIDDDDDDDGGWD